MRKVGVVTWSLSMLKGTHVYIHIYISPVQIKGPYIEPLKRRLGTRVRAHVTTLKHNIWRMFEVMILLWLP